MLDIIKRVSAVPNRGKSIWTLVTSTEHDAAVLRDAFMLLSTVSPEALHDPRLSTTAITSIRHFLSSSDPNDVFLFVSCLSCLDSSIWAGTRSNTVALLDEWEVQRVMRLLDSPDGLIRKTVIHFCIVLTGELTTSTIRLSRFSILWIQVSLRHTIRRLCTICRHRTLCPTKMNTLRVYSKSSRCKTRMT